MKVLINNQFIQVNSKEEAENLIKTQDKNDQLGVRNSTHVGIER